MIYEVRISFYHRSCVKNIRESILNFVLVS